MGRITGCGVRRTFRSRSCCQHRHEDQHGRERLPTHVKVLIQVSALLAPRAFRFERVHFIGYTERINVKLVHATDISLGLSAECPNAIWFPAETCLSIVPVTINIVVEREFLASCNVSLSEDAHPHVLADVPFCDVAIWGAAVVHKSCFATLLRRIQVLTRKDKSPRLSTA